MSYCVCGCSEDLHNVWKDHRCLYQRYCGCSGWAARGDGEQA